MKADVKAATPFSTAGSQAPAADAADAVGSLGSAPRRVAGTLLSSAAIQVTGIVSGALVARLLGPIDRGLLAAIILWPSVVVYVGDLGGPAAYTYLASTQPHRVSALLRNVAAVSGTQSVVLTVLGLALAMAALRGYPDAVVLGAVFTVCYIPLNLATRYLNAVNQGVGRFTHFNLVRVSVQFTYVAGIAALFAARIPSIGLVVAITLISNVVALLFALRGRALRDAVGRLDRGLVRETFGYGLRAFLGNLSPVEGLQLDLAAVFLLLGPGAAGLYAVALSTTSIMRSAALSLGMVAMPSVAGMPSSAQASAVARWLRLSVLLLVPSALVIALAAGPLVPLVYGNAFVDAVPLVTVLAFGASASGLRRLLGDCLRGSGNPTAASAAELVTLAVALACIAPLLWRFGALGAAVAVSLAHAAGVIASLLFARRLLNVPVKDLLVPRAVDARNAAAILLHMVMRRDATKGQKAR